MQRHLVGDHRLGFGFEKVSSCEIEFDIAPNDSAYSQRIAERKSGPTPSKSGSPPKRSA
jgi:hypothetical protein